MTLRVLAALALALAAAGPVAAADPGAAPLVAGYWANFIDHWRGVFQQQNGVIMGTLLVGAVCLFIITRGKWKK